MNHIVRVTDIEKQYGKPLADVLIELYNELGQTKLVAKRLGVNPGTIANWKMANRLTQVTVLRPTPDYRMES
jgi:transcriptional regulator of aromatic amino acid metabolism